MIPLEFPPGVTNLESKNAKIVNWREAHLIRWDSGTTMRPVKGWEKFNFPAFPSRLRKMHRWTANDNIIWTAYLCEQHCFVQEASVLVDITPVGGLPPPPVIQGGYGDNTYDEGEYGTPRQGVGRAQYYAPVYSLDNWGQELRAMTSPDGRYLGWSPASPAGTKLAAIAGAPISNRSFVVTPERHAMIFGLGGSFDKFGWSDEEDDTNWDFGDLLSRANFYDIYPKSPIVAHLLFEHGIIMFTTTMSFIIEWVGLPYVYSQRPLGKISVPISAVSICETPLGIMWPSTDGWWLFDGTIPRNISCPVWDFVLKNMNLSYTRFSAVCIHMANRSEVWWFFSNGTVPVGDNTHYILFDYRHGIWSTGRLNRTCGFVYSNDDFPIMSDGASVYRHESGFSYAGADRPWIESMNLNPNGGENWFTVSKILPDVSGDSSAIKFRMAKTNDRNGYTPEVYSPQRSKNGSGYVDIRETARDMRLRIDMVKSSNWGTVGPILFDNKVRGKK